MEALWLGKGQVPDKQCFIISWTSPRDSSSLRLRRHCGCEEMEVRRGGVVCLEMEALGDIPGVRQPGAELLHWPLNTGQP